MEFPLWAHLAVIIVLLVLGGSAIYAWFSLAPWVPTNLSDLKKINAIAHLKKGQTFVELGCGNGRVCGFIAKHNPEASVVGVELAFVMYLITRIRVALFGPRNLRVVFGDALKYDISDADVLYVYGLTKTVNARLKSKILHEMKSGAVFISYVFALKKWPGKSQTYTGKRNFNIHVYSKEMTGDRQP